MPEFKNPNAGGGTAGGGGQDSRSFLLMMLVMFGVLFGVRWWTASHNPEPASPASPPAVTAPATPAPAAPAAAAATTGAPALATVQGTNESTTVVENELYRITFSNRGADVTSWILKRYKDNAGHPLDMVNQGASKLYGYPLSLYTYDQPLTSALSQALYVPSATGDLQAPATLTFKYQSGNVQVTKTFTFGPDYVIHADVQVLRDGAPIAATLAWPAGFGDEESASSYMNATVDTMTDGKEAHVNFKKVIGGNTENGPFDWIAVADQYFGTAFLPDHPAEATLVTFNHQTEVNEAGRSVGQGVPAAKGDVKVPVLGAALGDRSGHVQTRVFVGPKDMRVLKSIKSVTGHDLWPMVDFGFWGPIGKFLFLGLHFTYAHIVSNWGWAIVIFTIFINVILLPLRVTSMKQALKMQRLQPQIDAIKKKHGNPGPTDAKAAQMNQEIMAFQKQEGVNPFGGCIPSLIQFPLLFAFFTMMTKVVELRQAHFFWLPDLSAPDPWHILPILMVVTSFAVQYFMPSPGVDPKQQRMMAFMMPAVSGYWTWNYASGLALYWNVGNIVMFAQQMVMNRTSLGKEMRDLQLKRARKKAMQSGVAPKTIQARR